MFRAQLESKGIPPALLDAAIARTARERRRSDGDGDDDDDDNIGGVAGQADFDALMANLAIEYSKSAENATPEQLKEKAERMRGKGNVEELRSLPTRDDESWGVLVREEYVEENNMRTTQLENRRVVVHVVKAPKSVPWSPLRIPDGKNDAKKEDIPNSKHLPMLADVHTYPIDVRDYPLERSPAVLRRLQDTTLEIRVFDDADLDLETAGSLVGSGSVPLAPLSMAGGMVNARIPLFDLNGRDVGSAELTAEWVDAIPAARENASQPIYSAPPQVPAVHGASSSNVGASFGLASEEQGFYETLKPVEPSAPAVTTAVATTASAQDLSASTDSVRQGARTGAGGLVPASDDAGAVVRVDASHRSLGGARYAGGVADSVDYEALPQASAPAALSWLPADRSAWPSTSCLCFAVTSFEVTESQLAQALVKTPVTVVVDLFSDVVETAKMTSAPARLAPGTTRVALEASSGGVGVPFGLAFPVASGTGALASSFATAISDAVLDGSRDAFEKLVAIVSVVQAEGAARDVASAIVPLGNLAKGSRGEWNNEGVALTDEQNRKVGFLTITTSAKSVMDAVLRGARR